MHLYISHSAFMSLFGGHSEHLCLIFLRISRYIFCECFPMNPVAARSQIKSAGGAALPVVRDKGFSIFRQESIRQP